jgi:hypothetical protein
MPYSDSGAGGSAHDVVFVVVLSPLSEEPPHATEAVAMAIIEIK